MKSNSALGKTVALIIMVIIVVAALATYFLINRFDAVPRYFNAIASSTRTGSLCTFSVLWTDNANVSGYIFGSNNTGVFQNDTWTPFDFFINSTYAISEVSRVLNNTFGNVVQWQMWCNDTNNNWNTVGPKDFFLDTGKILLRTSMGNITIQLYDDMPITTGNFKYHVKRGTYDNTIFHRVIDGFMIQGGDPTGTGAGDPDIPAIPDEFTSHNVNFRGFIAMANKGPNTGSTQFFINLVDNNGEIKQLDKKHPVFGWVTSGMDVVDAIGKVTVDVNSNRPLENVVLVKAEFIK